MRSAAGFLSCVALLVVTVFWLGEAVTPGAVTETGSIHRGLDDDRAATALPFDQALERALHRARSTTDDKLIAQLPAAAAWRSLPVDQAIDHAPVSVADLVPTSPSQVLASLAPSPRPRSMGLARLPIDGDVHGEEITAGHELGTAVGPDSLALLNPVSRPSIRSNRRDWQPGSPMIAIVIDDLGNRPLAISRLMRLPAPTTLSFLPYPEATPRLAQQAAVAGYEVFLHMPMEPIGDEYPGPGALMIDADALEISGRLDAALSRVPWAVGINNHMGSRFTSNALAMRRTMTDLSGRGLAFLDSRTIGSSLAAAMATTMGVANTGRDVFLDHDPSIAAVRRQLALVEQVARRQGSAVAIGHPNEATLAALEAWMPEALGRGFTFGGVLDVIAFRLCASSPSNEACDEALNVAQAEGETPQLPGVDR